MSKYSPEYLTRMHRRPMTLNEVRRAIEDEATLEARVIKCCSNHTLVLDLGKDIIAEITIDELEYHWDGADTKQAAATSKINKHIKFRPLSIEKRDDVYVVKASRRVVQQECFEKFIKNLTPGDIIDAQIIKIYGYGVFCDIGCGIVALLPTNNISITHVVNPIDALRNVLNLKVIVSKIDDNYKIELSHKELLGTWEEEASKFSENEIVSGTVLSIEEYGVFIRLSQNLSGLADRTELELHPGDTVSVKILSIRPESMKVKLLIKEKLDGTEGEQLHFKYTVTDAHIKDWVYSTKEAKRQIESHF